MKTVTETCKALRCCSIKERNCLECLYAAEDTPKQCIDALLDDSADLLEYLEDKYNAAVAGQETLQKALAEKNAEIEVWRTKALSEGKTTATAIRDELLTRRLDAERIEKLKEIIAEQDAAIERLKAENEILQKNADAAFQEGLNENRELFVKEIYDEIAQTVCDNTYPGADKSGKAVMIWKAKTGYDAVKELIKRMAGKK